MPSFCGISIHRTRGHSSSTKSSAKPITHNVNVWKPPRPSRDDGLFGVPTELPIPPKDRPAPEISSAPAQLYPPVRSPLRHRSERLPRERHPVDLGRSMSVGGYFECGDHYAEIMAPAPLRPTKRSNSVETANINSCETCRYGANTDSRSHRPTEYSAHNGVVPEQPRYGPNSRPPVTRRQGNLQHSTSVRKIHNNGEASVQIAPIESGRQSRLGMRSECGFPEPFTPSWALSGSPGTRAHHSTPPVSDFYRESLENDRPLFFMPVFDPSPPGTPMGRGGFI